MEKIDHCSIMGSEIICLNITLMWKNFGHDKCLVLDGIQQDVRIEKPFTVCDLEKETVCFFY